MAPLRDPMNLVLLGPPGAGKSTQTAFLLNDLPLVTIATGALLRAEVAAGTPLGQAVGSIMHQGQLVPDDLILSIVQGHLEQLPADQGFLLDGFPRNQRQAEALDDLLELVGRPINRTLALTLPVEEAIRRLSTRAVCAACATISTGYSGTGNCACCGGELRRRADDEPATIRQRQSVYEQNTAPLLDYFRRQGLLLEVDAAQAPDVVYANIAEALLHPLELEVGTALLLQPHAARPSQLVRATV